MDLEKLVQLMQSNPGLTWATVALVHVGLGISTVQYLLKERRECNYEKALLSKHIKKDLKDAEVTVLKHDKYERNIRFDLPDMRYIARFRRVRYRNAGFFGNPAAPYEIESVTEYFRT